MRSLRQWHWAAQYLAMAAKTYLTAREDDSQTNLSFGTPPNCLATHPLSGENNRLLLHLESGLLELENCKQPALFLENKSHEEVCQYLKDVFESAGYPVQYRFELHYSLPYLLEGSFEEWAKDPFMIDLRTQAHRVLEEVSRLLGFCQEIRIWPHHFDSGAFGPCDQIPGLFFGIGLAIPDEAIDCHYYYLSAYFESKIVEPPAECLLAAGEWTQAEFKGALLAVNSEEIRKDEEVLQFFETAASAYISLFSN